MSVSIGVAGTGRIGRLHSDIIANRIQGAFLAGVFDIDKAAATEVATGLGVQVYESIEELLAAPIDAIAICTSTDSHVEVIELAAAAGKDIFCEKPISLDLSAVDRALEAVHSAGVIFHLGFNRRFDPGHRAVRQAVIDGSLGELRQIRITSRDPEPPPIEYIKVSGGIFLDMTIHDFDMARYIADSEVVEVYARASVSVDPDIGAAGDYDTASIMLTHANGTVSIIQNCRQAVYGYDQRLEAFGSLGMATSENHLDHYNTVWTSSGGFQAKVPYFFLDRYVPSYVNQWEAFVEAIQSRSPAPVSGADGKATLEIGLAALISAQENRPVNLKS